MAVIGHDIQQAAALLQAGQLVAIPTETVYGLAANALNEEALEQIFTVKQRPKSDPLIMHVPGLEGAATYTKDMPGGAIALAQAFWPGPLTLLLEHNQQVPQLITAGLPRAAFRAPNHPMTQALLAMLPFPLAAPSANPFGYVSPTTAEHVDDQLGGRISFILDGGPCAVGIESTIVGFDEVKGAVQAVVYRQGGITQSMLAEVLGYTPLVKAPKQAIPEAPGMLSSHYAPHTPLAVVKDVATALSKLSGQKVGLLLLQERESLVPEGRQVHLAPDGRLETAAQNLYAGLRYLDGLGLDVILAERLPEEGLGAAMNDRLARAAAKRT